MKFALERELDTQDDVDRKWAELIEEIERQLQTQSSIEPIFTLRWTLAGDVSVATSTHVEQVT